MASGIETASKPSKAKSSKMPLPLEKRTDVTVDEMERMSLPYPAELYNGKVVPKMANLEHGLIQANFIGELREYLKKSAASATYSPFLICFRILN